MDAYRAVITKRDTRTFTSEPVDDGDLRLASCPMTFHDGDCARSVLGLPDDLAAPMGVAVGHPAPADEDKKSSPRLPLDELVRWGRWSD